MAKCIHCGGKTSRWGEHHCGHNRRLREMQQENPGAWPHPCSYVFPNGKVCGRTVRGGVCPNPDH